MEYVIRYSENGIFAVPVACISFVLFYTHQTSTLNVKYDDKNLNLTNNYSCLMMAVHWYPLIYKTASLYIHNDLPQSFEQAI